MASVSRRTFETIWFDHTKLEVSAVALVGDELMGDGLQEEIVNAITTDENGVRKLEFFVRDPETKERKEWTVPKHHTLGSIEKCFEICQSLKETSQ
jgi:stress response protein SCP2